MAEYAFLLDLGRCIGCQACVASCKVGNELGEGQQFIELIEKTHGEFPNLTGGWDNHRCFHCDDAACISVCPTGSLFKEDGLTRLDRDTCSGCSYCTEACPYNIPVMYEGKSSKCDDGVDNAWGLFISVVIGLFVGWFIGQISEWFTSDHHKVVKEIARQSQTGPATVALEGIAEGMRSAAFSVIVVAFGMLGAYWGGELAFDADLAGIYGIAIAAIGVLSTLGITVSVDAYGPIADNAGGIDEMAHLPPEVRETTDALDALGNTTAAIAKGFAIASAAVTALALFFTFRQAVIDAGGNLDTLDILEIPVIVGLFLGGMFPFLFASMTIKAVGRAANQMIEEVRRQFREIPGLREGREDAKPEYAKCVDISTTSALREMIIPGALAVALPLVVGFISVQALGGLLAGALVSGFLLAIFMANSGGAWDNAKKFIEAGAYGGKGSDSHKAAVVGDTIGDPFKDTSGPAMNIVIKVMTIVSLIFASAFV